LVALVEHERLVTLTGAGGIGKTRLALALAAAVAPTFADGCWFAELAPVSTGDDVVRAVAAAMGAPAADRVGLSRYVADRQVLIVLDNCEHVLSDAARLARALLEAGPEVVIVATSREPLGVDGEVVRVVASLVIPDDVDVAADEAIEASAVRLFVTRAAAATDQFELDNASVAAVVEICRQLDGIPLAIELAAARLRAMSAAEIARRLGERFRLLAAGRGAQERHRTLQAAVGWSYDLLSDEEQRVFRRLAVFPSSFDLDAAESVAGGDGSVDVIDVVVRLVERSLVQHDSSMGRYRLLETLRQFAADRLAEAGETPSALEAHGSFFLGLVSRLAPLLLGAGYDETAGRLAPELDNLRSTASWLADTGCWDDLLRLGTGAFLFLLQFSPGDGARWLRKATDGQCSSDQERVDAIGQLAYLVVMIGDAAEAARLADDGNQLAAERMVHPGPWAWATKAMAAMFSGDPETAITAARTGLAVASARHDPLMPTLLEVLTVSPLASLGDLIASQAAADKSVAMALSTGNGAAVGAAVTTAAAARLYIPNPDFAGALDILDRYAHLCRLDNLNTVWLELMRCLALVGAQQGPAVSLLVRVLRRADRLQLFPAVELAVRLLALEASLGGQNEMASSLLGYAMTNLAANRGLPMTWLDDRIEHTLNALTADERARHQAHGATLTRRELMSLVATLERTVAQSAPRPSRLTTDSP